VVAATPSCNPPYTICDELGIAHGNRLRCLNTTSGHPNHIEPGKRPRITLTPTIAVRDDGRVIAISVAGGDLQDQTTLNCLLDHLEFGMAPSDAVTAPRFATGHHENSFNSSPARCETIVRTAGLTLDARITAHVATQLAARGHDIRVAQEPIARPVMIVLDPESGIARAAGDPRAGRHAAACRSTPSA
jgi:gamma-glutamyltranspeptidase/glutathione hydrolase